MDKQCLSEDEFREFLRVVIEHAGGVSEFCRRIKADRSMVHKVLRGEIPPQRILLKGMTGIEERRVYALPDHWAKWRAAPHSLRK